jgi:hypothetical protein
MNDVATLGVSGRFDDAGRDVSNLSLEITIECADAERF